MLHFRCQKLAIKQDAHFVGVCTVYCSKKMNKTIMIPVSIDKDLNLFGTVLLIIKLVDAERTKPFSPYSG